MDNGKDKKKKSSKHKAAKAAKSGGKKAKSKAKILCPGSDEHKAQRWEDYEGDWDYERWENVYDANMGKASKSHEAVKAYRDEIGWGETEVTVNVKKGVKRRLDIADEDSKKAIEHKTGYTCLSDAIQSELDRDAQLVEQGWDITWHFEGTASGPLQDALAEAEIEITFKDD